jgi:hypothetical protein
MRNFMKLAEGIDVLPLLLSIKRMPELWSMDTYWKEHPVPVFREVDTIFLRFPNKPPYEFESEAALLAYRESVDEMECFDQPAFDLIPEARTLIFQLMARVQGERLGRVLINRLPPGAHVPAHCDSSRDMKYYDRFHIVLETNPAIEFRAGDEGAHMGFGEVWWFENAVEHEVWNRGDSDRIHMIIDIRTSRKA